MCGIFAIFSSGLSEVDLRKALIDCSSKLRHRGPDWSGYKVIEADMVEHNIPLAHGIAHERLAIMDPESGSQPLVSHDGNLVCAANGEIYNYKELYETLAKPYTPKTGSDCEVILPLYEQYGPSIEIARQLRGMFSFILYDKAKDWYLIVRDHMGITPLYIGWGNTDGSIYVASEMKALIGHCTKFQNFPPGHIFTNGTAPVSNTGTENGVYTKTPGEFQRWYNPTWAPEMLPGVPLPTQKYQAVRVCTLPARFRRCGFALRMCLVLVCRRVVSQFDVGIIHVSFCRMDTVVRVPVRM
jgi:asparagine synthase (glutamine-hydrolysing)